MRRIALFAAVLGLVLLFPSPAFAGPGDVDWSAHPGAGVAAAFGVALLAALVVAGIGCALCVLRAVFPAVAAVMDRQARASSPAAACLVGSLVGLGTVAAIAGAAHAGAQPLAAAVAILIGVPAVLLTIAGAIATVPSLAERILEGGHAADPGHARGAGASVLKRSVGGAIVLALALLGSSVLRPLGILMIFVAIGWPLGVGISALFRRGRSAPAAQPSAPPAP